MTGEKQAKASPGGKKHREPKLHPEHVAEMKRRIANPGKPIKMSVAQMFKHLDH